MMITVSDLVNLFLEKTLQKIEIYNLETGLIIFGGTIDELPDEFGKLEVISIDNLSDNATLVITVDRK